MQNIRIKCASCKIVIVQNMQSGKVLNQIQSIRLCDKHKADSFNLDQDFFFCLLLASSSDLFFLLFISYPAFVCKSHTNNSISCRRSQFRIFLMICQGKLCYNSRIFHFAFAKLVGSFPVTPVHFASALWQVSSAATTEATFAIIYRLMVVIWMVTTIPTQKTHFLFSISLIYAQNPQHPQYSPVSLQSQ